MARYLDLQDALMGGAGDSRQKTQRREWQWSAACVTWVLGMCGVSVGLTPCGV